MSAPPDPNTDTLVVVKPSPLNAETPTPALAAEVTPSRHVYVRSNFAHPQLDDGAHRIAVGGAVHSPFAIDMSELRALPMHTVVATMECAGNDRSSMRPPPPGELWRSGAVSTARWTGVPLAAVLERAGVHTEAVEILVEGADAGPREDSVGPVTFGRALPVADALQPDTLLAMMMNGEPLARPHGAPVRLIVPGWYGMASVKWVTRIEALTTPYRGYFQRKRYVYEDASATSPVTRMRVKSMIVSPEDGDVVASAPLLVQGWAWSGAAPIVRVEVAIGGGDTWRDAQLGAAASTHAWTPWELQCDVPQPGRYALRSRATDGAGNVQPDAARWNRHGYGNNAVRTVIIDVR
ncbi:MAG TPA: sulfite oxidase [Gemmatimonadaceae bacterium]|nr:sulfite oxidase [Gemmatimonadaceae bacterium]